MASTPTGESGLANADGRASASLPASASRRPAARVVDLGSATFDDLRARAPAALAAPVGLTALVVVLMPAPSRDFTLHAFEILCVVALCIVALCRLIRHRALPPEIGSKVAAVFAALVGVLAVAGPALAYPSAPPAQRLLLLGVLFGLVGNTCLVGSVWPVAAAYVAPVLAAGIYGLAFGGDSVSLILAVLFVVSGGVIGHVLNGNRKLASGRVRAAQAIDDHAFTIERLLLDFEETDHEWLWEVDARLRLRNVAPRMAAAAHSEVMRLQGLAFAEMVSDAVPAPETDGTRAVLSALKRRQPFRNLVVRLDGPDAPIWWRLSARPIEDSAGRFTGYRGIGADITPARTAEARIAFLATHDLCTGLPNRTHFQAHAAAECAGAAHGGHGGALLSIDLDGFKAVNDRLGHAAGDEVLKEVARRLLGVAKGGELVARLGGDEFAIWCPSAIPAKAIEIAERAITALGASFTLADGAELELAASIGIALTPRHATDADQLLVRADVALSRAKMEGAGQTCLFLEEFETSLAAKRAFEADLRRATARREFEIWYQPIVDSASGHVMCFEALLRWHSPSRGHVPPNDFIPAAEAAGLIVGIDGWVLQQACRDATAWPDEVHVAVNISPHHFRTGRLVQDVQLALRRSGLSAHRLDIEVTEGVFLDRSSAATATLEALRGLGIRIALDDFGTGYSSLSYLIDVPIDKIKIDRVFVRDLTERHESRAIVDAILTLARKLSIKVVAEGVETEEQALALKLRRCDELQGFLLAKARPASEVAAMLLEASSKYREAVPTHVDSVLGMALALKRQTV